MADVIIHRNRERGTELPKVRTDGEVRIVNTETGGEKGSKLARFDLIPARPLELLAEHYGRGSKKYEDRNWERGYKWSLSFAAMMRHAWAFWRGEDIDPETGSPHMVAVAWHAFALIEFALCHPRMDDRQKALSAELPKSAYTTAINPSTEPPCYIHNNPFI